MAVPGTSRKHRVRHPYHVMIKVSGPLCNLDCAYCYYLEKERMFPAGTRFRMDEALLERFISAYIGSHPGTDVVFPWHGGEPTVLGVDYFRKAFELQRRYLPPGWQCINVLQTNGTLIDEEWCRLLHDWHAAVGLSLDGPAAFHDACRPDKQGRPTHARVMHALELLQAHQVHVTVLCTVNARNVGAPLEVYRFFREHGVTAMQFLPIVRRTQNGDLSDETVPAAAYGEFLTAIFDQWLHKDFGRVWVQIFEECILKTGGDPGMLCLYQETCGDSLAMEHNGDLYACDHFVDPAYRLGNVRHRPLKALVESPRMKRFARAKRDGLPGACRECDVRFLCNGGCPKDRFLATTDGEPGLNYLCAGLQPFFRHARERLAPLLGA